MDFVVLPDSATGEVIAARLPIAEDTRVVSHASGRPWIVGHWSEEDVVSATSGKCKVVLLGCTSATADRVAGQIKAVRAPADLDALVRAVSGSVHLLASIDGRVRAQGSLSLARQIFFGSVEGVTIAADRPQTLAALAGTGIDEELLALHLVPITVPWPLSERCMWRGVEQLSTGQYLDIDRDGGARRVRWWSPPEPEIPLAQALPDLRMALSAAVEARITAGRPLSADLSGGMDSTCLCFVAAQYDIPLSTLHLQAVDSANDDDRWAAECAEHLPVATHTVIRRDAIPRWYAGVNEPHADVEAPFHLIRHRAMFAYMAQLAADSGARRHLQGNGGDELFHPSAMLLHALVRRHPVRALHHLRSARSRGRWSLAATLRMAAARTPYHAWLAAKADHLTSPLSFTAEYNWDIAPRLPFWVTPMAVDSIRRTLREVAAQHPQPLAPLPVQHEMLRMMQIVGVITRRLSRFTSSTVDVSCEAPYVDDRVIDTVMSIRLADRIVAGRFKPVLAAAMRGTAPTHLLGRTTKGDYSAEMYSGLRQHRGELLELFAGSRLAKMGLIDVEAIQQILLGVLPIAHPMMPFDATLGCESWLRSLSAHDRLSRRATYMSNEGAP